MTIESKASLLQTLSDALEFVKCHSDGYGPISVKWENDTIDNIEQAIAIVSAEEAK